MSNLFVGIKGHAVCICKETGEEQWRTKLKSMASITNISFDASHVYAYANGYLFCLDPATGEIQWENGLNGLGHSYCVIASTSDSQQAAINSAAALNASAAASGGS